MSDLQKRIRRAMQPVAQAFDDLGVAYAVVGSVAGLSHGHGRNTTDVDVLAELRVEHVDAIVRVLEGAYYADAPSMKDAIRHQSSFNLFHFETGIKVDVFVSKRTPYDVQVTSRREMESMSDGAPVFWVQTAEDLVLSKLRWFRMTNETSDRQWSDILAVLKVNCFYIDIAYLERWAKELRVDDLLVRALDESGITP